MRNLDIKKVYLPWTGEFGTMLFFHVRAVKADRESKIVCHEEGMECLYPEADQRFIIKRGAIEYRGDAGSQKDSEIFKKIKFELGENHNYIHPKDIVHLATKSLESFIPKPLKDYDFDTDIAFFARHREHGGCKNWPHWFNLIERLNAEGIRVFNAGHSDSSYHIDCPSAWDYDNQLEATIWAITHSKIRLGTGTGGLMLSLLCGQRPWLILTPEGFVDLRKGIHFAEYQHRKIDHMNKGWKVLPYLENWEKVAEEVLKELKL